ncbi:MAG TPA: PAS domain S-box protein [Burkholderiales bacterium]|nr:PAS domain S-box protein [Burkholderiales bacterium]
MSDRGALENRPEPEADSTLEGPAAARAESPAATRAESPRGAGYAGRPRDAQLEYKAILANASIGIAFTRDRKFTLCNPRFAGMFGWQAEELIGQSGEVVYPSRESYEAMGAIAVPVLTAGRQLDVEWEVRRRDGSTFLARMIAKALSATDTHKGTVWIVEDITERRRHADEVARLLREQDAILDTVTIGIIFVRDRRIVRCNRRMEEMYGYGPGELNGKPTAVTYAEDADYAEAEKAYALMARGQVYTHVMQARRRDGSLFWERSTGRAVDAANPARGSVWLLEDITEQRRAEEELKRVLSEQQALANNVVVGITFVRERKTMSCNRRYEELFGYEPGEILGVSTRQCYFTEEDYASVERAYRELDAGRTTITEHWLRRKDGSGFWCRMSGRALEPGQPARGYVWLFEDITERKRADSEVQRMVRELDLILENATVGIAFVRDHVIQRNNRYFEEMLGAAPGGVIGRASSSLAADEAEWRSATEAAYAGTEPGGTCDFEARFRRADGSTFIGHSRGRRIDSGGGEQEWIWSVEDVTLEREAGARVRRALLEQELILAHADVGIAFARNRVLQRCNPRFEQMFGYAPGELVGKSSEPLFASAGDYESAVGRLYSDLSARGEFAVEQQLRRKDGTTFWCKVVAKAIDPARPEEGAISIYEDITAERASRESLLASRDAAEASREQLERAVAERTAELQQANVRLQAEINERRQAESRAQHLADHDALTALPNRRLLEDRLTQALAASQRNRKQTAVMFVDLDRFKNINDSLGHAAGDVVLKECAERLVRQLREVDTICRMGGDEFVVVLPEIKRAADAANVAAKILETVAQPFLVEERELHITPSVGIAVFPDDGRDAESLIRNADAAMYHAKETGRANYQFFTEQMNQAASRRLALEGDLRQAVLKGEMRAWYQPVVAAADGKVAAHEALLRWQHPTRGIIEPAEFIQLADDTGLVQRLGEWLLAEACRWTAFIGAERGLPVGVNLSARQFHDPRLAETVARVLKETGLPPALLEFEVPEPVVMQNTDVALTVLRRLRELGAQVAIDGFGAAYSSLVGLRQLPVNKLKIDRSLVAEVQREGRSIVAGIVGLAHALELKVTAVGVESEAQREALKACGCDYLQGFLTGKPVDAETAAKDYL